MRALPWIALVALQSAGCYIRTQRFPEPMQATVDPLPPGTQDLYPEGPEEALVIRHADPVQIRPAGLSSSFPLPFYDKQARVNSGSWVFSGAGGRVEVLWPTSSSLVLFGKCTGVIGSPSSSESGLNRRNASPRAIVMPSLTARAKPALSGRATVVTFG